MTLYNVTTNQAGDYRAIIRDNFGANFSATAHLFITETNPPAVISFARLTGNLLQMTVAGEIGRSYRVESSTNLIAWIVEPRTNPLTSANFSEGMIIATNGLGSRVITNGLQTKFYRVSRYSPSNDFFNVKLKELHVAKVMWANAPFYPNSPEKYPPYFPMVPWESELQRHLKNNVLPSLPPDFYFGFYNTDEPPRVDGYDGVQFYHYRLEEPYPF